MVPCCFERLPSHLCQQYGCLPWRQPHASAAWSCVLHGAWQYPCCALPCRHWRLSGAAANNDLAETARWLHGAVPMLRTAALGVLGFLLPACLPACPPAWFELGSASKHRSLELALLKTAVLCCSQPDGLHVHKRAGCGGSAGFGSPASCPPQQPEADHPFWLARHCGKSCTRARFRQLGSLGVSAALGAAG